MEGGHRLPGWLSLTEKSICTLTSAALILQAAPLAHAEFKTAGALVALVLFGISFLLDLAARIAGRFTSPV